MKCGDLIFMRRADVVFMCSMIAAMCVMLFAFSLQMKANQDLRKTNEWLGGTLQSYQVGTVCAAKGDRG